MYIQQYDSPLRSLRPCQKTILNISKTSGSTGNSSIDAHDTAQVKGLPAFHLIPLCTLKSGQFREQNRREREGEP